MMKHDRIIATRQALVAELPVTGEVVLRLADRAGRAS
jgi:hypothetical protein